MDLRIGMRPAGIRFDVDVYAEGFDANCPVEAIEADGLKTAKAAREYIRKRGR